MNSTVQTQFEKFHDAIKLGRFEENQVLRDKRDIIRTRVKKRLPAVFEKHGEVCPPFTFRDQGSYELDTGIKPREGTYDIDQGLYFEVKCSDYPDPVRLKARVLEALDEHTQNVEMREPCVTVFYHEDGEEVFHVDMAVYAAHPTNPSGLPHLARGKTTSVAADRRWKISDMEGFISEIENRFSGESRRQFKRIVRYLKRWKDVNFAVKGHAAPRGIGLTVAAYYWLSPAFDPFTGRPDDLTGLYNLVWQVRRNCSSVYNEDGEFVERLEVRLPVEPHDDLFRRMKNGQMAHFKEKLAVLEEALLKAQGEPDPHEACKLLRVLFGDDFPVPSKQEGAKPLPPAIVSSSNAA